MSENLSRLVEKVSEVLAGSVAGSKVAHGELTISVKLSDFEQVCLLLRDTPGLQFEQLTDLCGLDMADYKNEVNEGPRFWVVLHLLSVALNQRIRVKVNCADDDLPAVPSVVGIWSAAAWYEREAFDLYGIVFEGNPDLRRILTDYGFIGHPFRKDFPLSGHVEMRYDPELGRVVYQPVSIEPREITPRIIREPQYGGAK